MSTLATYSLISFGVGILSAFLVMFANPRFTLKFLLRFFVGGVPVVSQSTCSNGVITFHLNPVPDTPCRLVGVTSYLNGLHPHTHTPVNELPDFYSRPSSITTGERVELKVTCQYDIKLNDTVDGFDEVDTCTSSSSSNSSSVMSSSSSSNSMSSSSSFSSSSSPESSSSSAQGSSSA